MQNRQLVSVTKYSPKKERPDLACSFRASIKNSPQQLVSFGKAPITSARVGTKTPFDQVGSADTGPECRDKRIEYQSLLKAPAKTRPGLGFPCRPRLAELGQLLAGDGAVGRVQFAIRQGPSRKQIPVFKKKPGFLYYAM